MLQRKRERFSRPSRVAVPNLGFQERNKNPPPTDKFEGLRRERAAPLSFTFPEIFVKRVIDH